MGEWMSWRSSYLFAVAINGISKQLCLRKFPQLSSITCITEPDLRVAERKDESSNSSWEALKRDHIVYASLLQDIETSNLCPSDCMGHAVGASSTDRYPFESIVNTLAPSNRYGISPSYWSSIGHSDPNAPETLIYKLKADLCCITEINIQPFEGDCSFSLIITLWHWMPSWPLIIRLPKFLALFY